MAKVKLDDVSSSNNTTKTTTTTTKRATVGGTLYSDDEISAAKATGTKTYAQRIAEGTYSNPPSTETYQRTKIAAQKRLVQKTNKTINLANKWLAATSNYLSSGTLSRSTRATLNNNYKSLEKYLSNYGNQIDQTTLKKLKSTLKSAYDALNSSKIGYTSDPYRGYAGSAQMLDTDLKIAEARGISRKNIEGNYIDTTARVNTTIDQAKKNPASVIPEKYAQYVDADDYEANSTYTGSYANLSDDEKAKTWEEYNNYKSSLKGRLESGINNLPSGLGTIASYLYRTANPAAVEPNNAAGAWLESYMYPEKDTYSDLLYEYVNGNPIAMRYADQFTGDEVIPNPGTNDKTYLTFMTDEEVRMYNYIYKTESPREAQNYIIELMPTLTQRQNTQLQDQYADYASDNPLKATVESVLSSPLKTVSYLGQGEQYLQSLIEDTGGIDANSMYNAPVNSNATVRQTVADNINKYMNKYGTGVGGGSAFLYQTLTSMADFVYNAALGGAINGAISGASSAAAGTAGAVAGTLDKSLLSKGAEKYTLAIMGAEAAPDTVIEAKKRGLSDTQAFTLGTLAGTAEILTEKLSVEALFDAVPTTKAGKAALVEYLRNNLVAEGSEEVASDAINNVADILISGNKSEILSKTNEYIAQGDSEAAAFGKAIAEQAGSMALSFAGGAISGLGLAGGSVVAGTIQNIPYNANIDKYLAAMTEQGALDTSDEVVNALIAEGLSRPVDSLAYDEAQQLQTAVNAGREVTQADVHELYKTLIKEQDTSISNQQPGEETTETQPDSLAELLYKQQRDSGKTETDIKPADDVTNKLQSRLRTTLQMASLKNEIDNLDTEIGTKTNESASIAEQTGTRYGKNSTDVARKAIAEAMNRGLDYTQAEGLVDNLYNAGYTKATISTNVARQAAYYLSRGTVEQITASAYKDANDYDAELSRKGFATANKSDIGLYKDDTVNTAIENSVLTEGTVDRINSLAKALETRVVIRQHSDVDNGYYQADKSEIVLYLDSNIFGKGADPNAAVYATFGHEITHRMQNISPAAYQTFQKAVTDYITSNEGLPALTYMIDRQTKIAPGISQPEALDEAIADFVGQQFFSDTDFADKFVNSLANSTQGRERRTILEEIRDVIRRVLDWLKGNKADTSSLEHVERALTDLLKTTSAEAHNGGTRVREDSGEIRNSIKSAVESLGFEANINDNGGITITHNGQTVEKVTASHVKQSGIGALIRLAVDTGNISKQDAEQQYQGYADVINMILATQNPDLVWAYAGASLFSAIKANSDGQYGTTIDFTTICRKTQEMITAMSTAMKTLHRGLTKAEVAELQKKIYSEGGEVPCPVCYVFARWAGVGSILDGIYSWQKKYKDFTYEQILQTIEKLEAANKSAETKRALLKEEDAAYMFLAEEQEKIEAWTKEKRNEKKKITAKVENAAEKKAAIDRMIKNANAHLKEIKEERKEIEKRATPELAWLKNARAYEDYDYGRDAVPADILFDLDRGKEFAELYPLTWKYRTTRGPSAGKAILPYSDMILGDMIMGVKGHNQFGEVKNGELSTAQKNAVVKAIARTRAQNLIGGQRFQSTSDFRYEYALDYFQVWLEAQAIGSTMQTYSKVVEFADLVAAVGGDCNLSVMGKENGYEVLPDGTKRLIFSSVTGINYDAAVKSSMSHDSVQLILVGINDEHVRLAMNDSYWITGEDDPTRGSTIGFIIPWHASGNADTFIAELVKNLGEKYQKDYYQDFSYVQTDIVLKASRAKKMGVTDSAYKDMVRRRELRENILKGTHKAPQMSGGEQVYDKGGNPKESTQKWTPTDDDLKFIQGRNVDISTRSFGELYEIEQAALKGDKKAIKEYMSWSAGVLHNLYTNMWVKPNDLYWWTDPYTKERNAVRLNSAQSKTIMPHEYWNKSVNRAKAYVNGFIFRSYCYSLGLAPRFTGKTSKQDVDYGNFMDQPGYWKVLIDRPMYDNNGNYRAQNNITVTNLEPGMLHPDYANQVWEEYRVQEPNYDRAARVGKEFAAELAPEQVKSVGNLNPTSNPDIRNSVKDISEEDLDNALAESVDDDWARQTSLADIIRELTEKIDPAPKGTEAFQKWFKNSKAVNDDGTPLTMYHWTNNDFTVFDTNRSGKNQGKTLGDGIYLSPYPTLYDYAGSKRMELYASIQNPFEMEMTQEEAEQVYDKYFRPFHDDKYNVYRPHVLQKLQSSSGVFDYLNEAAETNNTTTSAILKELGYDGVHDGSQWVAFDPNQVKLTTNENPTDNPDIRYSLKEVNPVQPTNDDWKRGRTYADIKQEFPGLWDTESDDADSKNPTSVKITEKSYRKYYDYLKDKGFTGRILDASSGLGYGTEVGRNEYGFDVEDIEPYPQPGRQPSLGTDYSAVNDTFDFIISNAVLNVLPQDQRDALVVKMGEMLNPGGDMVINVRTPADISAAKSKVPIDGDTTAWYISSTGSYQKGFTFNELKSYLLDALGDGYTVSKTNFGGGVTVLVHKNENASVRYSAKDSEGKELTPAQREYFKDSKVRDEDGNLLHLYSGTSTGGFTEFNGGKIWLTTVYASARAYGGAVEGNNFAPSRDTNINNRNKLTVDKRVEVPTTSDDKDSFFFDSQADLDAFEKKVGGKVSDYMDYWELSDYEYEVDEDEYEKRRQLSEKIEKEYAKYTREHSRNVTVAELLKNPDAYLREDFVRAWYSYDQEAAIDEDGLNSKEDLIEGLVNAYEGAHDEGDTIDDFFSFKTLARVPEGSSSDAESYNDTHVVYELYANLKNPYIVDNGNIRLNAPGSKYYSSVDYAFGNKDKYDGVIVKNVEVGPVGSGYGTTVVAFSPNQVKSVNNENPTDNPDIRYSKKTEHNENVLARVDLIKTNEQLRVEVDRLRGQLAEAKKQTKRSKPTLDPKDTTRKAKSIKKRYGSKISTQDLSEYIMVMAELVNEDAEANWSDIRGYAMEVAGIVINNSEELIEGDWAGIRSFLKGEKIAVDSKTRADIADYNDFRKHYAGNIILGSDGWAIDDLYTELTTRFGESLFPSDITNRTEQLLLILDTYDTMSDVIINPYSDDLDVAIESCAYDLVTQSIDTRMTQPTFADREAAKREKLRAKLKKQSADALKAERARRDDKLNKYKEEQRRKERERQERKSIRDENNKTRRTLMKIMQRLSKMKTNEEFRTRIDEIIGDYDLVAQSITARTEARLIDLKEYIDKMRQENPTFQPTDKALADIARLDEKHIRDMDITDATQLLYSLLNLEHEIRTHNDVLATEHKHKIGTLGRQIQAMLKDVKGTTSHGQLYKAYSKLTVSPTLRPETELLRMSGWNRANPLYDLMFGTDNSIAVGQRRMVDYQRRANQKYFRKFLNDKKFIDTFSGKKARTVYITGTDEHGKKIKLKTSPDYLAALYMHSQNKQNRKHFVNTVDEKGVRHVAGGITVPEFSLVTQGKIAEAYDGNNPTKITMSPQELDRAVAQLTAKEKSFCEAARHYYSEMSQPEINKVSEELLGYSLAKVDNYFRIVTDSDYRGTTMDEIKFDGTIEGQGWTKERVNASNPILLISLTEQLTKDIDGHSKYVGLSIPIRNYNKVMGINSHSWDAAGNVNVAYAESTMKSIKNVWGAEGQKYIVKLMGDLQFRTKNSDAWGKLFGKLRSNYAGAVLMLNAGVSLKQAASYWTAAAVIGWKPLMWGVRAIGNGVVTQKGPSISQTQIDLINRYSPMMYLRSQGLGYQEMADMKSIHNNALQKALNTKALNWIQDIDLLTVVKLWKATEYYVRGNYKNLTPGSEDYYKKCGEVHTEIIEKTQPNYSVLQRGAILRSDSDIVKAAIGMFKTQPFQNFSILYGSIGEAVAMGKAYRNGTATKADVHKANAQVARAVSSQFVSAITFTLMTMLWNIFRRREDKYKDDEGKWSLPQMLKQVMINMGSNAFGMIPLGSAIYETVQTIVDNIAKSTGEDSVFDATYYGVETSTSTEPLNNLFTALSSIAGIAVDIGTAIRDKDASGLEEIVREAIATAGDVFGALGYPVDNFVTDVTSLAKQIMRPFTSKYIADYYAEWITSGIKSSNKNDYYNILIDAYANGTDAEYQELYDLMVQQDEFATSAHTAQENIDSKIKSYNKTKFAEKYGIAEAYVSDTDISSSGVETDDFDVFMEAYAATANDNSSLTQAEVKTALYDTALTEDERKTIYDMYAAVNGWKKEYEPETTDTISIEVSEPEYIQEPELIEEPETVAEEEPGTIPSNEGYISTPESSWISGFEYDYYSGTLTVYASGRAYNIYNVSPDTYQAFKSADSKGSFYNSHFRAIEVLLPETEDPREQTGKRQTADVATDTTTFNEREFMQWIRQQQ